MPIYKAPLRDMQFLLSDVFNAQAVWQQYDELAHIDTDTVFAVLGEIAKFCEHVLLPLNQSGDEEGVHFEAGQVVTPQGFKAAYAQYANDGWIGLGGAPEWGGQGMPKMVTMLVEEMIMGVNPSFTLYPTLTVGAALALSGYASEAQKLTYLPPMYAGQWAGTMCLTESHCGTDLGIIKTRAIVQPDGHYLISGTKIFITGGDHDLTENIIHLVLAKTPDAPAGSKGISLFIVPKFLIHADGSLGARNTVSPGSVEHKMGIKASATCVMNFDHATGYLVGSENEGLSAMFIMMNYERLGMGLQGIGASEIAYQNAAAYACDRIQGRSATGAKALEQAADPIIVHPDVRRMLLNGRAHIEAGRCFAMYVAQQLDISKYGQGEAAQLASNRVALLTPIAKAFLTDKSFDACVDAQQVFGGHGYIREWGMEQYVRDVRIAQIYEGTNGIQALDLLSRKVIKNNGAFVYDYLGEARISANALDTPHQWLQTALLEACDTLEVTTQWIITRAAHNADEINAACVHYLHLFGLCSYAHMYALIVKAASAYTDDYYQHKIALAKYFVARQLPQIQAHQAIIQAGAEPLMQLDQQFFAS